eukprot:COSAG02_NODE_1326_length_13230_cov_13.505217_2_plen_100_part_00
MSLRSGSRRSVGVGGVEHIANCARSCDALTRLSKASLDGRRTHAQTLDMLETAMDESAGSNGLDCVHTREPRGDLCDVGVSSEIAAAINRLPSVCMTRV